MFSRASGQVFNYINCPPSSSSSERAKNVGRVSCMQMRVHVTYRGVSGFVCRVVSCRVSDCMSSCRVNNLYAPALYGLLKYVGGALFPSQCLRVYSFVRVCYAPIFFPQFYIHVFFCMFRCVLCFVCTSGSCIVRTLCFVRRDVRTFINCTLAASSAPSAA